MSTDLSLTKSSTIGPAIYRPIQLILLLVDTSASMNQEGKIQAVNFAISEALAELRDEAARNEFAEMVIQAICFCDGASTTMKDAVPIDQFIWNDVTACGRTDLGKSLALATNCMDAANHGKQGCPPVLCLLTDGQATDDYLNGLAVLNANSWAKKAVRIAIAVGQDADRGVLNEIVGSSERGIVLDVANAGQLVDAISKGTVAASRITSRPVSRTNNESLFASLRDQPEDTADVPVDARPEGCEDNDLESEVW